MGRQLGTEARDDRCRKRMEGAKVKEALGIESRWSVDSRGGVW